MNDLWTQWGHSLLAAIPKIIQAVIILAVVLFIDDRLQQAVERVVGRRGQRELARLLGRLVRIGVVVAGLVFILSIFNQTGIVASFIASLGIFGLVIAFALQDITKNFAAGVLLLIQRPFGLDDRIQVGAFDGTVTDISLRATALRTVDGHEVLIPNADVYSGPITNLTRYQVRRINITFAIPHTLDPAVALTQLTATLQHNPDIGATVTADHQPTVVVTGFTKDELTCQASFWVPATANATALTSTMILQLQQALKQEQQRLVAVKPA